MEVLQQSGEVVVKHAGWVRSPAAVAMLRQKGVQVVLIDPQKQLPVGAISPHEAVATTQAVTPESAAEQPQYKAAFSDEQYKAERVLLNCVKTQRYLFDTVRQDNIIDLSLVNEVSAGLADSIGRNQDVLLCLSRIAVQSDQLLQHSINCAIYMAAYCRYLTLTPSTSLQLITAALLHDIGKAVQPDSGQTDDYYAIPATLQALQQVTDLEPEVPLWVSQHCAWLDGSGKPPISGGQIEHGARMLAIVNNYENLISGNVNKPGPEAASALLLEQAPHKLDEVLVQQFIKCIGIYPPGSVVKLSSGKLALVLENNSKKPLLPKVKVFYHSAHQHHVPAKVLDLARQQEEFIDSCIELQSFGLDVRNYI